ncbi:MAG: Rrf2 family transcriptional regulator [Proteobacteria bacterium]|nr:Rrf2 family transcriptional regulator [Pseudomonadota bacterium]
MILSKTSEYAIRVATTLALLPQGSAVNSNKLSQLTKISPTYLSKILRQLVSAKILAAQKGLGGGFIFQKPLQEISLLSVIEAVDFSLDMDHCPFGWEKCNGASPCPLHKSYSKLKKDFSDWAEKTTLYSIAKQPNNSILSFKR